MRSFIVMLRNNYFSSFSLRCGSRLIEYNVPAVMGILNATPDSFFDGGRYQADADILSRAVQLADEGADIIDIGVVSTRPGATLLSPDDEAKRLQHVVGLVRRELPDAVISVDTCWSLPARVAIEAGGDIVNDISGGAFDPQMFQTVADLRTPYVLIHNPFGTPSDPSGRTVQHPCDFTSFCTHLSTLADRLHNLGVADVILDPGFGFSKSLDDNYRLFNRLDEIRLLFPNDPLLVAISRKSMIYKLLNTTPDDALMGTTALHAAALLAGTQMLRVHDVRAARQTIKVMNGLNGSNGQKP